MPFDRLDPLPDLLQLAHASYPAAGAASVLREEGITERGQGLVQPGLGIGGEIAGVTNGGQDLRVLPIHDVVQPLLEQPELVNGDLIGVAPDRRVQQDHLAFEGQRYMRILLEHLELPLSPPELASVAWSTSAPNFTNRAISRYCARSMRSRPATFRMAAVCAMPPTRDTERPASIAGRDPSLNRPVSSMICPSQIEMTLVGMRAEMSPARVSTMGMAVSDPPPRSSRSRAARSSRREWT